MTIVITIDIDWAPDPIIEDILSIIDSFGVPVTVFSTHEDGVSLAERHERALHPNFLVAADEGSVLTEIAGLYPDARGIRSHSLYVHTRLRNLYDTHGLVYESNYLRYGHPAEPFWMHPGVLQFPVAFMDDMWLRRGKSPALATDLLDQEAVVVYDFHPIHVFLNTPSIDHYQRHKECDDIATLEAARADDHGVRDVFRSVLRTIERRGLSTTTLGDVYDQFSAGHPSPLS